MRCFPCTRGPRPLRSRRGFGPAPPCGSLRRPSACGAGCWRSRLSRRRHRCRCRRPSEPPSPGRARGCRRRCRGRASDRRRRRCGGRASAPGRFPTSWRRCLRTVRPSVLATEMDDTRQQLMAILHSSALSRRIGRIGQPKLCRNALHCRRQRLCRIGAADDEALGLRRALDRAAENQRLDLIVQQAPRLLPRARIAGRHLAQDHDDGIRPGVGEREFQQARRARIDCSCRCRRSARRARRRSRRTRQARAASAEKRMRARCSRSRSSSPGSTTGKSPASSRATKAASRSIARVTKPLLAAATAEHSPRWVMPT